MTGIVLDREEDAPVKPGFMLITSEVEFLRLADSGHDLHIRGNKLCTWAEVFYRNREIHFQDAFSISRELEQSFPGLSTEQVAALIALFGERLQDIDRPLSAAIILNHMYPSSLWNEGLSVLHLARWLVWIYENRPSVEYQALMKILLIQRRENIDNELPDIYLECLDYRKAEEALDNWFGIASREKFPVNEEFPIDIPKPFIEKAKDKWNLMVISTKGKYIEQLESLAIPFGLKKICARETYTYYLENSEGLTNNLLTILTKYLGYKEVNDLRKRLPPQPPGELPDDPKSIIDWFLSEYLPYREWQESFSIGYAEKVINQLAGNFASWYLNNYPKALSGGELKEWLSYYRTSHIEVNPKVLTLIIVLDGLHYSDSRTLIQQIKSHTTRLSLISEELAFSPVPTITQFAKESLFRGVPPNKTHLVQPIGIVLPEGKNPAQILSTAEPGQTFLWRVLEPDRTYHHNNYSENLFQDVMGRLEAEALKIKAIVESIPDELTLQIIITTDHGRLLGRSTKDIPVPSGMQSHGRCAWGKMDSVFPVEGWFTQDNIAYLFSERFGLLDDMAIPLGENSFLGNDNRRGSESYPHGGLFPEEVIIPWYVFARDIERPKVTVQVYGDGRARVSGALQIKVYNLGDVELILDYIVLHYRNGLEKRINLASPLKTRHESTITYELDPWPSAQEASGIQGTARIVQANGLSFEYSVSIDIHSKDIYDRGENILEDLF